MNYENETIQDCIDKYGNEGKVTIINDGKIIDFVSDE